jgi:hypothetical protein
MVRTRYVPSLQPAAIPILTSRDVADHTAVRIRRSSPGIPRLRWSPPDASDYQSGSSSGPYGSVRLEAQVVTVERDLLSDLDVR